MMQDERLEFPHQYYDTVWKKKLSLDQYKTLQRRWRGRWETILSIVQPQSTVLDAGCGDGILGALLIEEKQCSVHGLDVSRVALVLAKERGLMTSLCDIAHDIFPYPAAFFDVVVFSCSLEHVIDPIHAVEEGVRVLKKGGLLIVTLPNAVTLSCRLSFLCGRVPEGYIRKEKGMHVQFFDYAKGFETRVLNHVDGISLIKKRAVLKNPRSHSRIGRIFLNTLIKLFPNVFGESFYVILQKNVAKSATETHGVRQVL